MYNANKPALSELPSSGQLLRSTGIAAGVAALLLATVVLPAEYGVDPTRVGSVLGLTEMGRIKQQLAAEAEADAQPDAPVSREAATVAPASPASAQASPPVETAAAPVAMAAAPAAVSSTAAAPAPAPAPAKAASRSDTTTITLQPDAATEIKLVMEEGARARFTWSSSGGKVNFDTHADNPSIDYHGYGKGSSQRETGELVAAFTGSHGWFWRNRTGEPVTITLETSGGYSDLKRFE